jgi:hypothetical protein
MVLREGLLAECATSPNGATGTELWQGTAKIPGNPHSFNQAGLQDVGIAAEELASGGRDMQITHEFDTGAALPVGYGVRVLFLSADPASPLRDRIAGLGGAVEAETEVYAALAAMIDDPMGYGLFVMDCDGLGGAEAGARAATTLAAVRSRVPVILISRDYAAQAFPQDRDAPVCLRAPMSAVSLRVGFEHALRDRLMWRAA